MAKLILSNKIEANQDSEDAMAEDDQIENYKGVFYGEETEQKYYEAGAHFSYKGLCRILESVIKTLSPSRRAKSLYNEEPNFNDSHTYKLVKKDEKSVKLDSRKEKEKEKVGSRNVKSNNLIPNNSLNNNNLSFLNKLNGKVNSKPTLFLNKNNNNSDSASNFKSKNSQNSKNNLIMNNNYIVESSKPNENNFKKSAIKETNEERNQENSAKSQIKPNNFYFKKIDPIIDKAKINLNRANSNLTADKKLNKNKIINNVNNLSNAKASASKKVSYIEKKEIYLHNKSKNSSIINLSNNVDQTTLTKSLNNANLSKQQNSSKNEINSSVKFELKNLDKIHKNRESDLFRFITSSIERIERLKDNNSKDLSPNNITSNTNNKTNEYNSPKTNKKDKLDNKPKSGLIQGQNEQISFEAKENGMNDIFANLGNLNIQNKSRNQQRNTFVKNNNFNSDKNPSFHSNTLHKNTMKEKSSKQGVLPRSTFEIENKTVHKVTGNQKFTSNFTLNFEKSIKKKENGGINYNHVVNKNNFLTKLDNATKINFRMNTNLKNGDNYYNATTTTIFNKVDVKKQVNTNKKTINKSISKERFVNINQYRDEKTKFIKNLQNKNTSGNKNNSYYLKKSEILMKYKGNLIGDNKFNENNRKFSYDNKAKNV